MDTAYRAALRRHYLRIGFAVFVFYLAFILLQLGYCRSFSAFWAGDGTVPVSAGSK